MTRPGPGSPPPLAARILRALLGDGADARSIAGDLFEEYRAIERSRGRVRARVWYWWQLLVTVLAYARPDRRGLETLRQDLGFAVRGLRREPGFTAAVVATLALAIGAGTAMFSVVDGVLLRPLPFDAPDELVRVWASNERTGDRYVELMYSDVAPFTSGVASFRSVAGLSAVSRVMTDEGGGGREDVLVARTTGRFFETLGVTPALGRAYDAAGAASPTLAVLSHEVWQRRFGGDPAVIGREIRLDDRAFEVVGVLPPGLGYPEGVDVWRALDPTDTDDDDREVQLVARLAPGARPAVARAEVAAVAAALAEASPASHDGIGAWIQPLQAMLVRDVAGALLALLGAAALVLLIACVNTANLLVARGARRAHEIAVRTALGAGRRRIVALRLTESLLLAALGGAAGLLVGHWVLALVLAVSPDIPRLGSVTLDGRVVTVMAAVTAAAGVLSGIGPALHAAAAPPGRVLRERGGSAAPRDRLRSGLVTVEIALSTALVLLALLLFATFRTAVTFDRGFEVDDLVAMTVAPAHPPETGDAARAYFGEVVERVGRLAGVRAVALSSHPLLEHRGFRLPVAVEGRPLATPTPVAYLNVVSPAFFATAAIPLLEGAGFSEEGGVSGDAELVVNDRFVREHLAGVERPVGTRVGLDWMAGHVVGVVGDVAQGPAEPALPMVFVSLARVTVPAMSLTVRTTADPADALPAVRAAIEEVDAGVVVEHVTVVAQSIRSWAAPQRFNMTLAVAFAALALALASVGIYGVTSFTVASRRSEIGIRRALGASHRVVALAVVRRLALLAAWGVALGLVGAASGARLLSSLLIGVQPTDPRVLVGVLAIVGVTSVAAVVIPVARALRTDPRAALGGD